MQTVKILDCNSCIDHYSNELSHEFVTQFGPIESTVCLLSFRFPLAESTFHSVLSELKVV